MRTPGIVSLLLSILLYISCSPSTGIEQMAGKTDTNFKYMAEQFGDFRILRFKVPGFENLNPRQKKLVYYLYQAALSGRDILWDQHYRHNLLVRRTLENIVATYNGNRDDNNFAQFMDYLKRVWFSNGIHHEQSTMKLEPGFSFDYFETLAHESDPEGFPLGRGHTVDNLLADLKQIIFDPRVDSKRVNLDPAHDLVMGSANNFYAPDLIQAEVEGFYKKLIDPDDPTPVSHGLNSKLVRENGKLKEKTWKVGGMYSEALEKVVYWLEKAVPLAENDRQRAPLKTLIKYFRTGDLALFDEYCILWVQDTVSAIDVINGFIETYGDATGFRATYESMVYFKDQEATKRIDAISSQAQWFEDHSPIMDKHKKEKVKGVSARVITSVVGSGAVSPGVPIGINLPNANWIRANYGSKSVTIGNYVKAYNEVRKTSGLLEEFYLRQDEIELARKYGDLADDLHVDLHEVIGHASGKLEPGIATPKETLKSYAATIEEARADLVALYFMMDPKLVEIGVMPTLDVGRVAYDDYITNALMIQLSRIAPGQNIEEAHMRNRLLAAQWAYEKGLGKRVIEKTTRPEDGKTFFVINDYEGLRKLFGELLREIQRIKSRGDYEAGRHLVETYGVKIDPALHAEVLERYKKLGIAKYSGFLNPKLVPVMEGGEIADVKIEYPEDFTGQMLYYAREYSFLPTYN
jgi:dipeptidyl-peptidase III